jgi:hypothetical protein
VYSNLRVNRGEVRQKECTSDVTIEQKRLFFSGCAALEAQSVCVCFHIRLAVMRYILHLLHVHRFLRYLFPPITGTCPGYSLAFILRRA